MTIPLTDAPRLALIYGHAFSPDECRRWTRRSMQVSPGGESAPPAVLGAQAMARAMTGEAAAALRKFSFLPDAPTLVPDAQADALTVRGLLRLWAGDEPGADDDLTAVVSRIRGGLRPRYPGQALGYLAETAFRLGRWDEAQARRAGRVHGRGGRAVLRPAVRPQHRLPGGCLPR